MMKQTLRHIFLLLALFIATANAWSADCTYTKTLDGSSHTSKDFNHTICSTTSEAPNVAVSIKYTIYLKKTTLGKDLTYTLYAIDNSNQQHEIASGLEVENGKTVTVEKSFNLNKDITSFKIDQTSGKFGGNRDITISNVTVTYKYAPSLTTSKTTLPIEDTPVGSSSSVSFFVDYQNSTNSATIVATESSDTNNSFSISPTSKSITDCSGSIEYTITFSPQSEQEDAEATYVISGNGASLTVTVTATSFAMVKPEYTCHIANSYMVDDSALNLNDLWTSTSPAQKNYNIVSWTPFGSNNTNAVQPAITNNILSLGQAGTLVLSLSQTETTGYYADSDTKTITINKYGVDAFISQSSVLRNEIIDNPFSLSYGLIDFDVESKNTNIAEYHKDTKKIQTYFTDGTASFQITRPEDYKYNKLDKTLTLEVYPAGGCNLLTAPDEVTQEYSVVWEDRIYQLVDLNGIADSLIFKLSRNNNDAVGKTEVQQYVNGGWSTIASVMPEGKNVFNDYKFPLDSTATKVRFYNGYGSYKRTFKDVYVTRKTYLRPSVSSLALPQATIGKPVSASFDLSWSTCSDEIKVACNNDKLKLNVDNITPSSNGYGTTTITVTYDANSGSQSGTVIIYDQSQKKEINVSCEVKSKLATEIIYTGEQQYGEIADGILYPFYVKDENGNTVTGATITLETSNEDILSFDENKIYPHCGGSVTLTANYAGDATHEPATLEKIITIADCNQQIIWDQDFRTYLATEDGSIAETTVLEAYAIPTGTPITYTLDEAAAKFAEIRYNTENRTYSLYVHGVGKGFITASVNACNFEDEQYLATEVIREIRVHKEGDPCDSYSIDDWNEYNITLTNSTKVLNLSGLPETTMTFWAHAQEGSISNELKVDFSKDGNNWEGQQEFSLKASSSNTQYTCNTVVEGAKYVRFRTGSTLKSFFHGICIRQKTYLTPSVNSILIENAIVNQPFTYSFTVDYSDVPLIQHSVTNDNNLGLTITPANEDIHNVCGEYGSYTFTLTGTSLYPQTNVTETLTITTPVGHDIKIPVTITSSLLDTYYFNQQDGNWSDPANWTVNGSTPSTLPTASNPVVIAKKVTIDNNQAVAYSVEMQDGAHIKIASTGGLTVHAGGYTTTSQEPNLEITIDKEQAGYFRMSPLAKTDMPKAKVYFTTRGQLNGGNLDAAWQYIGAPGGGVGMDLAHTTVLYLRSEEKGWVRQYTEWAQLTPFAGYALTQKEQSTFTLYPQLLNGEKTIQLTYTENGMRGDNLWANSYMAPLDITKFTDADFTGDIDKTFYLYNSGSWNQWNEDKGAINSAEVQPGRYYAIPVASARALDATYDQNVVPPMQGVYMKANSGGGTITLNYEKHVWNNTQTAKMNTPLRVAGKEGKAHTQSLDFQRVRLQVNSENSGADRMYIIQDSVATAGYDNGYDAPKLMADGLVNIYTNEPFGKMEISSTDHMDGMFIGFQAGEDTHYIMTFTSLVGDSLYLYDLEEDKFVKMLDGEQYHFSAIAQSTNDMRFQVLVAPTLPDETPGQGGGVTTDVENITTPQLWISDRKVFVSNAKPNSTMAIYTASGMLVTAPYALHTTPYTLDLSYLPTGVYVLRLNDQAYKFICK